jgi:hypothetical protein
MRQMYSDTGFYSQFLPSKQAIANEAIRSELRALGRWMLEMRIYGRKVGIL